jgi:hypothetical protein
VAIVAFWLATTGYFVVWPEVRARLLSGEAPPVTIDLLDEAHDSNVLTWSVRCNGQDSHKAISSVTHFPASDTFELKVVITPKPNRSPVTRGGLVEIFLTKATSTYLVTREGALLSTTLHAEIGVTVLGEKDEVKADFTGEVRGGRFFSHYRIHGRLNFEGHPDSVDVSDRGSILNPLHPVSRIQGVRPGQRFRVRLVDPTGDVLRKAVGELGFEAHTPDLEARVQPESGTVGGPSPLVVAGAVLAVGTVVGLLVLRYQPRRRLLLLPAVVVLTGLLAWGLPTILPAPATAAQGPPEPMLLFWEGRERECLVIEYHDGDELRARTWVEKSSGLVLRQEAFQGGESWVFTRTTPP